MSRFENSMKRRSRKKILKKLPVGDISKMTEEYLKRGGKVQKVEVPKENECSRPRRLLFSSGHFTARRSRKGA